VRTKDSCWSVRTIYNPRELTEVSTVGSGVDGVLQYPPPPLQSQRVVRVRMLQWEGRMSLPGTVPVAGGRRS
jgi:hypothetical protein